MKSTSSTIPILLLLSAVAVLTGRGLQGLLHDLPLRALLWDEGSFAGVAKLLGYEWSAWVTSAEVNEKIALFIKLIGGYLLVGGLLLCWPKWRITRLNRLNMVWLGGVLFALLLLSTKENFWRFGYFIEYALQVGSPFLLLAVLRGRTAVSLLPAMRVLTALTFIGHGLFAMGYYPVPFHFLLMTMEGLGGIYLNFTGAMLSETEARSFLYFVGWLDFLAAATLLIPWHKLGFSNSINKLLLSIALGWIIPWALLTTMARWWSNAGFSSFSNLLFYWGPEVLIRLPHVLIPLLIWRLIRVYAPNSSLEN